MNGPFFSERPIVSPCSSTPGSQTFVTCCRSGLLFHPAAFHPLCAPQFLESAHRPRHAVRYRAKRTYKSSALGIRCFFHRHGPTRFAQPVKHLHRGSRRKPRDAFCGLGGMADLYGLYGLHGLHGLHGLGRRARCACGFAGSRYLPRCRPCSPASCCAHHDSLNLLSHTRRARLSILPLPQKKCFPANLPPQRQIGGLRLAALNDVLVGTFVVSRLRAQRGKSPRGLRVIALHAPLTTAVRMVHRIHGHTAYRRSPSMPPDRGATETSTTGQGRIRSRSSQATT